MNKRRLFFLAILAFLALSHSVSAQEEIIQDIREKCALIDSIKSYDKVQKDVMGRSTEGGHIVGHFEKDNLRKIIGSFYYESGRADNEYYFWEENLIFVFCRFHRYTYPINIDYEPIAEVKSIEEHRHYFRNGKMIKWVDADGKEVAKDSPEYQEREQWCIKDEKEFPKTLNE